VRALSKEGGGDGSSVRWAPYNILCAEGKKKTATNVAVENKKNRRNKKPGV
jgi:hypothetical protein